MPSKKVGKKVESQFPSTVYVHRAEEGEDSYLIADESLDGFEDGDAVGVYELIQVHRLSVERCLL